MTSNSVVVAGNNSPHVVEGNFTIVADTQIGMEGNSIRVVEMVVDGEAVAINKAREGLGFQRKGTAELHADIVLTPGQWTSCPQLEFDPVAEAMRQNWD